MPLPRAGLFWQPEVGAKVRTGSGAGALEQGWRERQQLWRLLRRVAGTGPPQETGPWA
jgi:hypothetical protein